MKLNGQFLAPVSPASLLALRDGPGGLATVNCLRKVRWDNSGVLRAVFTPPRTVVPIPLDVTITVQRAASEGAHLHVHGRRGSHAVDVALTLNFSSSIDGTQVTWSADLAIRGPATSIGQRVARDIATAAISDVLHQAAAAA